MSIARDIKVMTPMPPLSTFKLNILLMEYLLAFDRVLYRPFYAYNKSAQEFKKILRKGHIFQFCRITMACYILRPWKLIHTRKQYEERITLDGRTVGSVRGPSNQRTVHSSWTIFSQTVP